MHAPVPQVFLMSRWYILLLAGICLISTSAILVTLAAVPPTVSAFYRNFFAGWNFIFKNSEKFIGRNESLAFSLVN